MGAVVYREGKIKGAFTSVKLVLKYLATLEENQALLLGDAVLVELTVIDNIYC